MSGLDPSSAPLSVFRLARTKSGWRAGAPTKIRLAAAPNFSVGGGGGIRRQFVSVHIKGQMKETILLNHVQFMIREFDLNHFPSADLNQLYTSEFDFKIV